MTSLSKVTGVADTGLAKVGGVASANVGKVMGLSYSPYVTLTNSMYLPLDQGATPWLERTPATAVTGGTKFTIAGWFYRVRDYSEQNAQYILMSSLSGTACYLGIFDSSNCLVFGYAGYWRRVSSVAIAKNTWYAFCINFDSTQATEAARCTLTLNNSAITFNTSTAIAQNDVTSWCAGAYVSRVGGEPSSGRSFPGYLAHMMTIDGYVIPSSTLFTGTGTACRSLPYTGSYGNNGFLLDFATSGALGTDTSGRGNTFTVSSGSSPQQSTLVPY